MPPLSASIFSRRRTISILAAILAGILLGSLFFRIPQKQPPAAQDITFAGHAMGCDWSVTLHDPLSHSQKDELQQAVTVLLEQLEARMSTWREDSELSRFNRSTATDWFGVSAELAQVVGQSLEISRQSGGAFDITIAPLVNLWGFGPRRRMEPPGRIPETQAIETARGRVGFRKIECRQIPPAIRKAAADVAIDLGAVGKGFAVDRIAAFLDSRGQRNYLISLAGELRAKGNSKHDRPWRVGIETPVADVRRILLTIELQNMGVSTSGDYRNFFEIEGQRFSHEIDPRTGRPINHNLVLVSVLDDNSARADALATALLVLGPEEGPRLAKEMRLSALFVTRGEGKFETQMTPGFERVVQRK